MRKFFASFFGTLAALVVVFLGSIVLLGAISEGLKADRDKTAAVEHGSWLVLDLSDQIRDAPAQNEGLEELFEALGDRDNPVLQSRQIIRALRAAATDDDIAGLYLSGQDPQFATTNGYAALQEVRNAIVAFRESGKPVKAWLTMAGTREYYLASAANEISLDPFGSLLVPGLASQSIFFAGAFEKFGIGVQVTRVGRFKSAVEPYTRRDMSPESRAQTEKLLGDIWSDITVSIEASRDLPAGTMQTLADEEGLIRPETAKSAHLVDRVVYVDEVLEELRESTGAKGPKVSFKQISIAKYGRLVPGHSLVAARPSETKEAPTPSSFQKIAIVYAEGPIVDGTGQDKDVVWSGKLSRTLREIRRDATVKALVLRVNSPGGSVTASEAIQREVRLVAEKIPVVVSMGSVAASGGYWISTYSERIFAEPTTITGSIGVFGVLFNVQGLASNTLALAFDTVKTGRFADATTVTRPKSEAELAVIQKNVDWIYGQFISKVAESRKLQTSAVQSVAEGRVWSGTEAKNVGLVDEIGGLEAAIAYAAEKASLGEEFVVAEYPERRPWIESFAEMMGRKPSEKATSGSLGAFVQSTMRAVVELEEFNDPRGVYARLPFDPSWQ